MGRLISALFASRLELAALAVLVAAAGGTGVAFAMRRECLNSKLMRALTTLGSALILTLAMWLTFLAVLGWTFPYVEKPIAVGAAARAVGFAALGNLIAVGIALYGGRNLRNFLLAGAALAAGASSMAFAAMGAFAEPFTLGYHLSVALAGMFAGSLAGARGLWRVRAAGGRRAAAITLIGAAILLPILGGLASILPISEWSATLSGQETFALRPLGIVGAWEVLIALGLTLAGAVSDLQHAVRIAAENNRLRQLTDSTFEALLVHRNGVILDANAAFCSMIGRPLDRLRGAEIAHFVPITTCRKLYAAADSGVPAAPREVEIHSADGASVPVEILCRTIAYAGGEADVTAFRDIRERRVAEERIRFLAHHDALTGLANRYLLQEVMRRELEVSKRDQRTLGVFSFDVDHFKDVNDTLGHQAGDRLLQEVSERIRANVREADLAARVGGDEFVLLQTAVPGPGAAAELAVRLGKALMWPYTVDDERIRIRVSVGIALAPQDGWNPDVLLRNSDIALYRAKAQGAGGFCFFKAGMDTMVRERRALEQALANAIEEHEFRLFYQPIIDSRTARAVGFEALLRWPSKAHGFIPPAEFIPLAEETGLITRLGAWVLETACRTAVQWPEPLWVAVNVSPRQFASGNLPVVVGATLNRSGLPAQRLELEITEGVLIKDTEQVLEVLRQVKTLGVRVALDDFGTGYSSLSSLHRFPFDKVKIDRSFVGRLRDDPGARAIVSAILAMSRELGLAATAEGVEVDAEYGMLRGQGCGLMQGYLFGRPMPAQDVSRFLAAQQPKVESFA